MASQYSPLILHFITLSLLVSSSLSDTFTSLDVSGSIRSTLDLFSLPDEQLLQNEKQTTTVPCSSSSSLTVEIHPRAKIHAPVDTHADYKSLTESRLARDSARVNSLLSKAELAIRGISRADFNPVDTPLRSEDLQAPLSSGASQGSGEYFSRLGVGSPAKEYYMVIDTGSDISWLQCQPCSDCYKQSDPVFNPTLSSSYASLSCSTRQCRSLDIGACRNGECLYQVSYGDGSYTVGNLVTETVSFGTSGSVPKVAIGCGHDNEGLFVGSAGLLGLGGGPLSMPSQIKATSFSYCLVDRDSRKSSTLEFNSAKPESSSVTAPILRNSKLNTFYYVGLTGFSVGGRAVSIPPGTFAVDEIGAGGVIVDSGTAVTRLPSRAYTSLRDAFTRLTRHLKAAKSFAIFDTCYDFSSLSSVKVPTVALSFAGGQQLELPAKNYLIPVDSEGTFCFAFAETTSSMSIIGNVQQQGTRVHYDLAKSQVTFSENSC